MGLLARFDPPASYTKDFIPSQLDSWNDALNQYFDRAVSDNSIAGTSQFYNPTKTSTEEPSATDQIPWQGFPLLIESKYGGITKSALDESEKLRTTKRDTTDPYPDLPLTARNQDEYLEWRVVSDSAGGIDKIVYTSEPREVWETLANGYPSDYTGARRANVENPDGVYALYKDLVGAQVVRSDIFPDGKTYDPWNKWNTKEGLVHLTHPANSLFAEIQLAGAATVPRVDSTGQPITGVNELILCSQYGTPGRDSDPHIGARVNTLARAGYNITVLNPAGLYITAITNLAGITKPGTGGTRVPSGDEFFKVTRGTKGQALRAEFAIPPGVQHPDTGQPLKISDIEIDGVSFTRGGQLAKYIQMSLTGLAYGKGQFTRPGQHCPAKSAALAEPLLSAQAVAWKGSRRSFVFPE